MSRLRTVATVAVLLVAATAGSATAGALITGARIQDDTVAGIDVRDQSLTGFDVQDRSLTLDDFVSLPTGPQGEPGPQGTPGANGLPNVVQRVAERTIPPGQRRRWTALCNAGETSVSGGVGATPPGYLVIEETFPDGFNWSVQVRNTGPVTVTAYAWALCVPV